MKLLKLDARFEDARRVARCLVGSIATKPSDPFGDYGALLCVGNEDDVFYMDQGDRNITECEVVFFHIDTIKFCPFVAMREGVSVHLKNNQNDVFGDVSCIQDTKLLGCLICIDGENYILDDVTLNIAPIERGELEGCEIVEVVE